MECKCRRNEKCSYFCNNFILKVLLAIKSAWSLNALAMENALIIVIFWIKSAFSILEAWSSNAFAIRNALILLKLSYQKGPRHTIAHEEQMPLERQMPFFSNFYILKDTASKDVVSVTSLTAFNCKIISSASCNCSISLTTFASISHWKDLSLSRMVDVISSSWDVGFSSLAQSGWGAPTTSNWQSFSSRSFLRVNSL